MLRFPYVLTRRHPLGDLDMFRAPDALLRLGMLSRAHIFALDRQSQLWDFPTTGVSYGVIGGPTDPGYHLRHLGEYHRHQMTSAYGRTGEELVAMATSRAIPQEIAVTVMADQLLRTIRVCREHFGVVPLHGLVHAEQEDLFQRIVAAADYEPFRVREELF